MPFKSKEFILKELKKMGVEAEEGLSIAALNKFYNSVLNISKLKEKENMVEKTAIEKPADKLSESEAEEIDRIINEPFEKQEEVVQDQNSTSSAISSGNLEGIRIIRRFSVFKIYTDRNIKIRRCVLDTFCNADKPHVKDGKDYEDGYEFRVIAENDKQAIEVLKKQQS